MRCVAATLGLVLFASDAQARCPYCEQAPAQTPAMTLAGDRGMLFHPATPDLGKTRIAVGMLYDVVDPQTMMGMSARLPKFTMDGRVGLGKGFSAIGHLDTLVVFNELTVGAAWAHMWRRFSIQAGAQVGAYLGWLDGFGFAATYVAPMFRPQLTVGYTFGEIALSLRGDVIVTYPQIATVGDSSQQLSSSAFTGCSLTLTVENPLKNNSIWYYGAAYMLTRSYYQMWILFPDDPSLYSYARLFFGYAF